MKKERDRDKEWEIELERLVREVKENHPGGHQGGARAGWIALGFENGDPIGLPFALNGEDEVRPSVHHAPDAAIGEPGDLAQRARRGAYCAR